MSGEKQETLAAIAAEYREMAAKIRAELSQVPARREDQLLEAESLEREADRIEAAAKRERGDTAAMREALVWLSKTGYRTPEGGWMCITLKMIKKDGVPHPIEVPPYAEDIIKAALAAPPRNCDVGTPKEQKYRFVSWCESHDRECENCPLRTFRDSGDCWFEWMQMPYDEKGEGDGR